MAQTQRVVSATEKALRIVEKSSRIRLQDTRDNIGARTSGRQAGKNTNQAGHTQGALERAAKPPLGWIWGDFFRPWQRMFPGTKQFNADINLRREYTPLSLIELSRLIDLGWIDASKPIDVSSLCSTRKFRINPNLRQCGFDLTAEGADAWTHPIDVEVQYASQTAIAAIERVGGRVRTAYYDPKSLQAAVDPKAWFLSGQPIPRRLAPPPSLLEYYTNPVNRGYLAEENSLKECRIRLASVMGNSVKEVVQTELKKPTQVFHGIPSGSVVSIRDKKVFCPTNPLIKDYYSEQLYTDKQ